MMKPVPAIYALALLALTTPAAAASFSVYDDNLYEVAGVGFRAKEDCTILPTPVRAWSNAHRYTAPAQVVCADVAWLGGKWGIEPPEIGDGGTYAAGTAPIIVAMATATAGASSWAITSSPPSFYSPFSLGFRHSHTSPTGGHKPSLPTDPSPVPLPAGVLLLAGALAGLRLLRKR